MHRASGRYEDRRRLGQAGRAATQLDRGGVAHGRKDDHGFGVCGRDWWNDVHGGQVRWAGGQARWGQAEWGTVLLRTNDSGFGGLDGATLLEHVLRTASGLESGTRGGSSHTSSGSSCYPATFPASKHAWSHHRCSAPCPAAARMGKQLQRGKQMPLGQELSERADMPGTDDHGFGAPWTRDRHRIRCSDSRSGTQRGFFVACLVAPWCAGFSRPAQGAEQIVVPCMTPSEVATEQEDKNKNSLG